MLAIFWVVDYCITITSSLFCDKCRSGGLLKPETVCNNREIQSILMILMMIYMLRFAPLPVCYCLSYRSVLPT